MIISLATAPATEPVTADEVRARCKIDAGADNDDINRWIKTARTHVENVTRRALIEQTWDMWLHQFPRKIVVPKAPLISVEEITYIDQDGVTQTLDEGIYTVDSDSEPGLIYPAYGQVWPLPRCVEKAIKITFKAGYGDAEDVPEPIVQAIFLLVAHMNENIEETTPLTIANIPYGAKTFLRPFKVDQF